MLDTTQYGKLLRQEGFKYFSGVPCSYLSPLINDAINQNAFIMANNEGDAVAIASGISLVGESYGVVLMQNSGLSNALSPLTSLNYIFKIPILGFVSLRGESDSSGKNTDEPQHELLGSITDKILEICKVPYIFLSQDMYEAQKQLQEAKKYLTQGESFFFIVKNKTFNKIALQELSLLEKRIGKAEDSKQEDIFPTRLEALEVLQYLGKNSILLATTGKSGRELYEINDSENQLYMVGSMGCVGGLGLGISLQTNKKVIAIDGDSALLMRLGALSTNAYYARMRNAGNFCHILLDNQSHDSTGGQFNLSPFVDFTSIALSCGYERVCMTHNLDEFQLAIAEFLECRAGGAWFIYLKIARGSKENLGRPKVTPQEVAKRLREWVRNKK
ncbi:phosphonopyruvate decarboxylase [Helicobacter monodelphidis]|uniref:phosphonopyruvate decarboxylase n=1 Tax=Helicobacter sp. 15-1451 TaxID=2004995 RepID=UPI000DCB8163|nr:phosphonopyruvate decarboxylase [Helicobacter sp. 15-1451]RAX57064.1 phosphonopyruvate decarboxylase [Helicobacter sp. 15-1451]